MGIQKGIFKIQGSFGDITYYKRKGKYLYRKRTCLNKERFETDGCFEGLRKEAGIMGSASKLASAVYKRISGERDVVMYRELVSVGQRLIREGKNAGEVGELLGLYARERWGVGD